MTANKHDRKEGRSANRRLAQWLVKWLIEHSTSHQLLWCIDSLVLRNPPTSCSCKPLPASLKDYGVRMNFRNKHKMTGQMNHQTAYPKPSLLYFYFFPKKMTITNGYQQ